MLYKMPNPEIEGAASMSLACLQWLYKTAQKMRQVVEVGSYKGRSIHALLSGCQGTVYAVDNWIMPTGPLAGQFRSKTFQAFQENVGGFPNLKIVQMPSLEAAGDFKNRSIDMVFIDGDHSYEAVTADIAAWLPKARKLICGHDFSETATPGVVKAVKEMFRTFEIIPGTNIWAVDLTKSRKRKG